MNQNNEGLYSIIKNAVLPDGSLPVEFELPKDRENNHVVFADGAMDGIMVYHSSGSGENDLSMLTQALEQAAAKPVEETAETVQGYFESHHAYTIIDDIQQWIIEHRDTLDAGVIHSLAVFLAKQSSHAECVKFGLSILELFEIEDNPDLRELVLTLGLSDEFTLFSIFIVRSWKDGNAQIWQLAKKLSGWGKIHAVEQLEANTEEIRNWILCYGCENSIMNEYLALTCAEKCGLTERLRAETLSEEAFAGACTILSSLLTDHGPCANISACADADILLERILVHIEKRPASVSTLTLVLDIKAYIEDKREQSTALLQVLEHCKAILDKTDKEKLVHAAITAWDENAVSLANRLAIDVHELVYQKLSEDPVERNFCIWYLYQDEAYAKKTTELYEKALPLDEIATGADDAMGFGPAFQIHRCLGYAIQFLKAYPLMGEKLLQTALQSPVINNRTMAVQVLQAWREKLGRSLCAFSPLLYEAVRQLIPQEKEGDHQKNLEKLLAEK